MVAVFTFEIANAAVLSMKLIETGTTSAVVIYNGQKITVRKYYPTSNKPLGPFTTDMRYLTKCIKSYVIATVDDTNGEILSLMCGDKTPVLVVPDEFIRIR